MMVMDRPWKITGKITCLIFPLYIWITTKGPLWLRVGNQQIAWGEALFFRVFDVVQGLDLRRHSFLGVAAEEYSDSRIPSLAIRGSYRFANDWELEGYAQRFRPTILPRPGTPYNVVAEAFTVFEEPGFEQDEDDIDVGFRFSGQWNDIDLSFMAVSRTAPDGTYRWARNELYPDTTDPDNGDQCATNLGVVRDLHLLQIRLAQRVRTNGSGVRRGCALIQ